MIVTEFPPLMLVHYRSLLDEFRKSNNSNSKFLFISFMHKCIQYNSEGKIQKVYEHNWQINALIPLNKQTDHFALRGFSHSIFSSEAQWIQYLDIMPKSFLIGLSAKIM